VQTPHGYTLQKCCVASPRSEVYIASCENGSEVVLKTYSVVQRGSARRLEREFELLRSIEPGIGPRALALESVDDQPLLVLEKLSGESLRGPLPIRRFLALAVSAAHAVGRVHAARIVHRNLRPENLLISGTDEVHLLGFGRAAPLGAPSEPGGADHAPGSSLHYMAPEQTGRLERGVDFRSDLYALGATFYELLSGRPPFDARDPLDLIHAHIAQRARPLVELVEGVPSTLSRILMKLLEKEPEDRYQTAEALMVDLDTCREQLERTGAIDEELPLGTADAPYRPLFRRRIYGRESECAVLQRCYGRALGGEALLLLVRGAPGIGKSSLIPELHRPLALDGGYLARGKFDLYRGHLPYAGLTHALRGVVHQISTESDARRLRWRETLCAGLGKLAGVVAELMPELRALLGEIPPVPPLEPRETQQRLALAVRRLIFSIARHARPLVLFLDDLQWADAGSRFLLEEFLSCGESAPLLVIGAYRDNEVSAEHPLQQLLERLDRSRLAMEALALGPLSSEACREMLADALGSSAESVTGLAERLSRYTSNNPLLIQQCVYHLHQLGCIRFVPRQGWTWDLEAADAAAIPDDPVGMLIAKLQRLRADTRSVTQLASCVGDQFDAELLAELSHRERGALEAALYDLSDEGLIAPCGAGFRFVHDRIREAAQALSTENQRAQLHLRTARLLLERLSEQEQKSRCFEVADHLSRAADQIPEAMRVRAAELHHTTGIAALKAGASANAAHYFNAGLALLRDGDWSDHAQLGFDLHLRASECAYQTREFERGLELLDRLEDVTLSPMMKGLVAVQRVKIYMLSRSVRETFEQVLATLDQLGEPLPRQPSWLRTRWAIARTDWRLRRSHGDWRFRRASSGDLTWTLPMLVRSAGGHALGMTSIRLMCLSCAEAVRTMLERGCHVSPTRIIAAYAAYRTGFLQDASGAQRLAAGARHWSREIPDPLLALQAENLIYGSIEVWTGPRRSVVEPLKAIAEACRESGDLEYSTSALLMAGHYLGLSGHPVADVARFFGSIPTSAHLSPTEDPHNLAVPYRALIDSSAALPEFEGARSLLERFALSGQFLGTHWMAMLCVFGRFADAWWISELVRPVVFERLSQLAHVVDHTLFRGLAAAVCAREARGTERWHLLRAAARSQRYLRGWARYGPDFRHMAALLEAERARTRGRTQRALALFERAAAEAEACAYVHHAALAHERRADLLGSLGKDAERQAALACATALYRAWGADAKVRALG
jgi:hypothetical protein